MIHFSTNPHKLGLALNIMPGLTLALGTVVPWFGNQACPYSPAEWAGVWLPGSTQTTCLHTSWSYWN